MTLFLLGGLLTLGILALLALPFLTKTASVAEKRRELAIYKDQLTEIDRDRDRGVLTDDQAHAARLEIERRLLKAAKDETMDANQVSRWGRLATIALIAALPLGAGAIYLGIGRPDLPAAPFASRVQNPSPQTAEGTHAGLNTRIAGLEERLANKPDDLEGWALLARTYGSVGDYQNALRAYAEANRLGGGGDRRLAGEYAEMMVIANDGMVPLDAVEIFRRIRQDYPDDPQARYYMALRLAQTGDQGKAVEELLALRADSPADAPWLPTVNGLLGQLDPDAVNAPVDRVPAIPGPTAAQMEAAQSMTAEQQQAMIDGMVSRLAARLEENPEDVDGWRRLARAYEVLGRTEDAANAHREVLARAPDDPAAKAFLGE